MEDKIFDIVTDLIRYDISKEQAIDKLLILHSVSNRRKLLIATIEKVRYNLDGYGALTSSQIAERLEKAINCC